MKVIGTVKKVKFRKDNFAIVQLSKISCSNKQTQKKLGRTCDCKMNVIYIVEGDTLEMEAHTEAGKYGELVIVAETSKILIDYNEAATEHFLKTRGGIKPKNAKLIIENLGLGAVSKIAENPSSLDFLSLKDGEAEEISNKLRQYTDYEVVSLQLCLANIPLAKADNIISEYGNLSARIVKTQPYKLLYKNILTFTECDRIAYNLNLDPCSYDRIQSAIYQYLNYNSKTYGNVYEDKDLMNDKVNEFLSDFGACKYKYIDISDVLSNEINKGNIIEENNKIYKRYTWQIEKETAEIIKNLAVCRISINPDDVINDDDFIKLDKQQQKAVLNSLSNQFSLIAGFAGSGKTTSIKTLLKLLPKNKKIRLLAPTGKAAERMTEATGYKAETIHRALKLSIDSYETEEILMEDVIIIDESTMIDLQLFHCLITHIWSESQIIMLGDPAQLPSVGNVGGNVFYDLLRAKTIPSVILQTVHRQSGESGILKLATDIRSGKDINFNNSNDLKFIKTKSLIKSTQTAYNDLIAKYGIDSVVVLSGTRKVVEQMNDLIQYQFNKQEIVDVSNFTKLAIGDKVMCIKNDYEKDVFNGDVGTVINITDTIKIEFKDEKIIEFNFDEADNLQLAYSMTIHKSQGSEYNAVILVLDTRQQQMINKNLLYTAITRAKKEITIIYDDENIINECSKINVEEIRKSQLTVKIS